MTAPVPPAIDADAWAHYRRTGELSAGTIALGEVQPGLVYAGEYEIPAEDVAPSIALLNAARPDDDPGKITPLMVRQLRETAAWHRSHGGLVVADGLDAITAALASILPTEGT